MTTEDVVGFSYSRRWKPLGSLLKKYRHGQYRSVWNLLQRAILNVPTLPPTVVAPRDFSSHLYTCCYVEKLSGINEFRKHSLIACE